ncbi:hypothetical protein F5Y13DRAFT_207238 [Hypoxylon sp. FL1857]|nr:hypothetical protein F5Y13DRAFT_207238 [Hypoxylon sp. FL1857]
MATLEDRGLDVIQSAITPFPFNKLPTEIRFYIWEEALLEESSERLVILDYLTHKVIPFKSLVSPMLIANRESRCLALKFFDLKLIVCNLPCILHPTLINSTGRFDLNEINQSTNNKNRLYLSSRHDTFIIDLNLQPKACEWCLVPATYRDRQTIMQLTLRFPNLFDFSFPSPRRHYASELSDFRSRIEKVIHVHSLGALFPYLIQYCPRQSKLHLRGYSGPKTPFPIVEQHFYCPWVPKQKPTAIDLLQHLFQRRPGHQLLSEYRIKELDMKKYMERYFLERTREMRR